MLQKLADAFIVMPGGLGTLEEAIETWNAIKIGELNKKIGFLNIDNYFDKLFEFMNDCKNAGFMRAKLSTTLVVNRDPSLLLSYLVQATEEIRVAE